MIEIFRGCNVHITFANGVTVSLFIGGGSYSDNWDDFELTGHEQERERLASSTAELAAWKKGGKWITKEIRPDASDAVLGRQTAEQLLDFMKKASNYK